MEIASLQRKIDPANVPLQDLPANSSIPEKEKIGEVCRQFESVLLLQILRDARKAVLDSQKTQDSSSLEIYADMINHQLADSISHSGMFGVAKSLETQFTKQISSSTAIPQEQSVVPESSIEKFH